MLMSLLKSLKIKRFPFLCSSNHEINLYHIWVLSKMKGLTKITRCEINCGISDNQYYSVVKRNELSRYKKTWRKCVCVYVKSQFENATYYVILAIWHFGKLKAIETLKNKISGCHGLEGKEEREGRIRGAQRIFRAVTTLSVWYSKAGLCCYTFVQTQKKHII
jgi:hypothetical protein